jgi:hypothetical protein
MSTQPANDFTNTALLSFKNGTIREFVEDSRRQGSLWGLFGRPELVIDSSSSNYSCNIQPTDWLNKYNIDDALDNLMNFYTLDDRKHNVTPIHPSILSSSFAFNCNLANILNIDFSKNFTETIDKLMSILNVYASIITTKSDQSNSIPSDVYDKIKWIILDVLPTLCMWMSELHILRASKLIYDDYIFDYIGKAFILLQGKTYAFQGMKVAQLSDKIIPQTVSINLRLISINKSSMQFTYIEFNKYLDTVISNVNTDTRFNNESERNVTLAAIYDLRYKNDRVYADDVYFAKSPYRNTLTAFYKEWLREVNADCKIVHDMPKNTSGEEVKTRICTFLGAPTRKSIDPAVIEKLNVHPISVATLQSS